MNTGDTVKVLPHALGGEDVTGKEGTVITVEHTDYGFSLVWLIIDGEQWMFFSDELELVEQE